MSANWKFKDSLFLSTLTKKKVLDYRYNLAGFYHELSKNKIPTSSLDSIKLLLIPPIFWIYAYVDNVCIKTTPWYWAHAYMSYYEFLKNNFVIVVLNVTPWYKWRYAQFYLVLCIAYFPVNSYLMAY